MSRIRRAIALATVMALSIEACSERRVSREETTPSVAVRTSGASGPTAAGPTAAARTLLWRIEHRGRVSHLLGTLHVGVGMRDALGSVGTTALDQSTTVFIETGLDPAVMRESLVSALVRAQLPEGESLRALVGEQDFVKVTALLREFPAPALDRLEPSLVAIFALGASMDRTSASIASDAGVVAPDATATAASSAPSVSAEPMDYQIAQYAQRRGVRVNELEAVSDQLAAFTGLGRAGAIEMLRALVRNPEANARVTTAMVEAYRSASAEDDVAALVRSMNALSPQFARMLIDDRNDRWMPTIERAVQAGGAFFAVGAAHTVGPKGIVAALRARGYTVERVRTTAN